MVFTFDLWKRLIATDPALFMRYAVADGFTPGRHRRPRGRCWRTSSPSARPPSPPGSAAQLDLDIALDITPLLGAITAPTLVIGAEDDRWVDVSHSRALAEAIAGSRLEVLPAGHVVIQELAADVARLLHEQVTR